jgi:hypothetical protein
MAHLPPQHAFASARTRRWEPTVASGVLVKVQGSGLAARLLGIGLALTVGCAHGAKRERATTAETATSWLDGAALIGEAVDPVALEGLASGPPRSRIARLDLLLDLFDAARFAEDEYAREGLWAALGGHALGIGPEATREATARLLQEALAIEAAIETGHEDPVDDEPRRFLTDAIMLLSVDLELPVTAEDLAIRTLAYRTLAEQGHPRIVANARWRLYDHVRGTLEGAVDAPPAQRMDVAVQALYAERDEVDAWLDETVPHARPAWPTSEDLWSALERHRDAIAKLPSWSSVLAARNEVDDALRETVLTVLPASRDPVWRLPTEPTGTGREESLAPVLLVTEQEAIVDAGRPGARRLALGEDPTPIAHTIRASLVADGRGVVLLAADPELPSPQLTAVLQGLVEAQATRIELAIREPRLEEGTGEVVVALPLEVARPRGERPHATTLAVLDARIGVHLTGRGPRFTVDERPVSVEAGPRRQIEALVRTLARAYPRERVVRLTLGDDVMPQQLVDLLAALQGGPDRPFRVVGWSLQEPSSATSSPATETLLRTRADAHWPKPGVVLAQAYPLHGDDQKRLEAFAESLGACVPELELPPPASVRLDVTFDEGRLVQVRGPDVRRLPPPRAAAFRGCVEELALPFRLARHRDRVEVGVTLSPP